MSDEIVNCNQDKIPQRVEDICKNIFVPNEKALMILEVFARYVNSGLVSNALYPNTLEGKKRFVASCYTLMQRYPSLKLIPEDIFTGTCAVKGNLMVYGKLAVKIGTQHENFNRIETRQNKHFDDNGNFKFTDTKIVIYGKKDNNDYVAYEGNYISKATDTATKEAEYSKFLRQSLVKAFPDKYAFGYYEPEDGLIPQSGNKKQPISREEYEAKAKAKQEAKQLQKQKEAEQIETGVLEEQTDSETCLKYLKNIQYHIQNNNIDALNNLLVFFADPVQGLTEQERQKCQNEIEKGKKEIAEKEIADNSVKDVISQATGKVNLF